MQEEQVNMPVLALMSSVNVCLEIVSMLPQTDFCDQLRDVLFDQMDLILRLESGEIFDEDEIIQYCEDCDDIVEEIQVIKRGE